MNNVDSRSTDFLIEHRAPPVVVNFWTVLRQIVIAAVDLYLAVSLLYLAARLAGVDAAAGLVALMTEFLHLFLLTSLPVIIITLVARSYRRAAILSLHGIAFIWLFGVLFLPQPTPACLNDCQPIDVLTFNIVAGRMPDADLRATLLASGAEVIALQEVGMGQQAFLEAYLAEAYPHQSHRTNDIGSEIRLAVLSIYPIVDTALYADPATGLPSVMTANLNVNGRVLRVINVHAAPSQINTDGYTFRAHSALQLAAEIAAATPDIPIVLLGDFNTTDQSSAYGYLIDAGLSDAFRAAGSGFSPTYPAPGFDAPRWLHASEDTGYKTGEVTIPPVVRIDHVLHSEHFEAVNAMRGTETSSDHYPVQVSLHWYSNR